MRGYKQLKSNDNGGQYLGSLKLSNQRFEREQNQSGAF